MVCFSTDPKVSMWCDSCIWYVLVEDWLFSCRVSSLDFADYNPMLSFNPMLFFPPCISYIFMCNTLPQNLKLPDIVSVGQEFMSGLVEWLWLRVCQEVALSVGRGRSDLKAWLRPGLLFRGGSFTWLLAGGCWPRHMDLSGCSVWVSSHFSRLPLSKWS